MEATTEAVSRQDTSALILHGASPAGLLWAGWVGLAGLLWAGWAGWAGATPTSFSEGWRGRWVVLGAEIPPGSFASRGSTKTGQDVGLAGLLRNTC